MSNTATLADSYPSFSETAEVRVVSRRPRLRSDYKLAYVLVSSRIYWKVANKHGSDKPQSFLDFQNADSVELVRLEEGTWNDVDDHVKIDSHNGRQSIIVYGRPHGRTRLHKPVGGGNVQVEIIPNAPEELEGWVNQMRARITPWNLLQQEVQDIANRATSYEVEEIEKALGGFVTSEVGKEFSSFSTSKVKGKRTDNHGAPPEEMEKLSIVDQLTAHGTAAVQSCAALSKLVAEHLGETAVVVGDATKFVAGVSSIFHLVALGAKGVSMFAEASRGRRVLVDLLGQIMVLLKYILKSISGIMKSSRTVNQTDTEFVFDVFKQAVGAIDMAEAQVLRGRGSQIVNAGNVKEVEKKVEELRQMAVIAGNTSKYYAVEEKMDQIEEKQELWADGLHHMRPSLSAFFSGRSRELDELRDILERWGSAVITQYGGLGKTELLIALADRAERDGVVPGGVFWVTVDGGERDVIESLAKLAEKLTQKKMDEDERRNGNLVVAAWKQGLDEREGRWLLCLDNADDKKVSGILNEVCVIPRVTRGNGWVVVTSRQGQPHIWSRMKKDQKLVLEPLSVEDAMVALWRQIQKIETGDADDDGVMNAIEELERDDIGEYQALKELCADEGACGLGGLPLALVQAGTYIAQFECSVREYLNMFKNANRIEDMQDIMKNTDEVKPIQESQRSIWTTWQISVGHLSNEAYSVLRAMAMLGAKGVGEAIVKGIVIRITGDGAGSADRMFRTIVIEALVHGSSLIRRDEGERQGREGWMYRMHRLVRLFVLRKMEPGSGLWNEVHSVALVTVHEGVKIELAKEGKSFDELPDVFGNQHHEFMTHAISLVNHHTLPKQGDEILHVSKVEDIYRYCGKAMEFMGKPEEVQVWEHLVQIWHHQQASSGRRSYDGHVSDEENYEKSRTAYAYSSLGNALMENGKLDYAISIIEQSLGMYLNIHGHGKPHPDIARSLNNLGRAYELLGRLVKALEKHEQSLEMRLAIHGNEKPHPDVATSLNNLGNVYEGLGELDKALEKHQESLKIKRAIHGHDRPHPAIANSFNNLGSIYEEQEKLDEALENHKKSLEMRLEIYGHEKPHPDIARSLNNLGSVYERLDELDKALENHEQSLEMRLAIHGHKEPHPDIAMSLSNLGSVYEGLGRLDEALEKFKQSLKMKLAIHGHEKPDPDIATSLNNLGNVYVRLGNLDEALEKYKQSLEMERAIHGDDKPHTNIAISLCNIGCVYHKQKSLNQAAEFLEQSIEMLQTVHTQNLQHPHIMKVLWDLAGVYEDQGRRAEASEIRERIADAENRDVASTPASEE